MGVPKSVFVIGTGTIGEPLIGLLADFRQEFGIERVIFHKYSALVEDRTKVVQLVEKRGAVLAVDKGKEKKFKALGMKPELTKRQAIDEASVVIDCTPKGFGNKNKRLFYEAFTHNTLGFIAQGSEKGFGKPYVHGVNDEALVAGEDQFIQVVSCNTHNLAVLIQTLALKDDTHGLVKGRFVCMRRANDISQSGGFVPAPTVDNPVDKRFGSHHARDAHDLFETLGLDLNLFSSAIKLDTQYMHTIWFSLELKHPTTIEQIHTAIADNPRVAVTHKKSTNLVFSFGRDHGHYGRILNNTVIVLPSLHLSQDGRELSGYCFTPQDGNSLLSSIAATLWLLYPNDYTQRLRALGPFICQEI